MSSSKSINRKALSELIRTTGFLAAMFCTFCTENGRTCIMTSTTSRCSECVRTGRSKCDGKPEFLSGWDALAKQEEKLEQEEEEAMAKILRVRKQKKFIQRRRNDMMARGLRSLEELDAAEEKDKKDEEERQAREKQGALAGPTPPTDSNTGLDPSFDPYLVYPPGDPFWAPIHFGGETPPEVRGN